MIDLVGAPATIPDGRRVYAVGDVHGCADRLGALHERIARDLAARPVAEVLLVHLGDYIDRGPDSAGVLRRIAAPPRGITHVVNLLGNHEAMMLEALDAAADGERGWRQAVGHWLANGGTASLVSWRIDELPPARWAAAIGGEVIEQLRGLRLRHAEGGYLFVHAGVRPGVHLLRQVADDLLWMREPFLSSSAEHGAVVVHGHTPVPAPQVRANRIGIDTGAVTGGALTCLVLEGETLGFLHS